jgi:hypothetical protein
MMPGLHTAHHAMLGLVFSMPRSLLESSEGITDQISVQLIETGTKLNSNIHKHISFVWN